jgi:hypothetical protein
VGSCRYAEIEYVRALEVMFGFSSEAFDPGSVVVRGQAAVFTARVVNLTEADLEAYVPDTQTFPDVEPDGLSSWCYKEVEYIVAKGVPIESPDGMFHPNDEMDVYEAATWLATTGTYVDPDTIPPCDGAVGSIGGTVTDIETSEPIVGATVSCAGLDATTGVDGTYLLSDVAMASGYTVTATAADYYGSSATDVAVAEGQTTTVDFALAPSGPGAEPAPFTLSPTRWEDSTHLCHRKPPAS